MHKSSGFTLAEVLITLGIIGVVAALTLPSVISNHNRKATETKLAKFYSMVNQAIQRSTIDNGETASWYDEYAQINDEFINKYFMPYFKGAQYNSNNKSILFADGTGMIFYDKYGKEIYFCTQGNICANISSNQGNNHSPGGLFVPPNTDDSDSSLLDTYKGKKVFAFTFAPAYYARINSYCTYGRPVRCYDSIDEIGNGAKTGIEPQYFDWEGEESLAQLAADDKDYGTLLIHQNGWKIPKGYPTKF